MNNIRLHITLFLLLALPFVAKAQVFIGEGISVKGNTTITVVESNVVVSEHVNLDKNSITFVDNDGEKNLVIYKKRASAKKKNSHITKKSESSKTTADEKEDLPVRYVNIEGESYVKNKAYSPSPEITKDTRKDVSGGVVVNDMQQLNLLKTTDYIFPIYSNYFTKERFSSYAKLYEFEYLTALLRPPIA